MMPNPGDVILLGVQTPEGQSFEPVHHLTLLILGRRILKGKAHHAVGVAPLPRDAVDQIPCPLDVAA